MTNGRDPTRPRIQLVKSFNIDLHPSMVCIHLGCGPYTGVDRGFLDFETRFVEDLLELLVCCFPKSSLICLLSVHPLTRRKSWSLCPFSQHDQFVRFDARSLQYFQGSRNWQHTWCHWRVYLERQHQWQSWCCIARLWNWLRRDLAPPVAYHRVSMTQTSSRLKNNKIHRIAEKHNLTPSIQKQVPCLHKILYRF